MSSITILIFACLAGVFFIAGMLFESWLAHRDRQKDAVKDNLRLVILNQWAEREDEEGS